MITFILTGLYLGLITWTLLEVLRSGNALTCLNCDAVANPRLCTHVTECFAGEKCGIETFISSDGDLQYKLGCVHKTTCGHHVPNPTSDGQYISCNQCCDSGNLCNVYGCNSIGFPVNRGPICYNCEALPKGHPCHRIAHCEYHEVCFNDAQLEFQTDILHTSGCRSRHHCASETIDPEIFVGRRTASVCTDCCRGDLCNVECSRTSFCADDPSCAFLKVNYDVCNTPEIASQFCKKTCNLCAPSGMTSCMNTRLDCANIAATVNICGSKQDAVKYGCMQYCGYCSGATTGPAPMVSTTYNNIVYTTSTPSTATYSTKTYSTSTTASTTSNKMPVLHVGDKVIRGPDWHNGDQDGNSTGVVIAVLSSRLNGSVVVRWDRTKNQQGYFYGRQGKYEVQLFARATPAPFTSTRPVSTVSVIGQTTTSVQGTSQVMSAVTSTPQSTRLLVKGDLVVRGPDWTWKDQDGNTTGVVTGSSLPGWVTVRWGNGFENSYRYGVGGKYDVSPVNKGYTSGTPSGTTTGTTIMYSTTMDTSTSTIAMVTPSSTNNIILSTVASMEGLHDGDRVVRGPDWIWGNQDGGGTGTVTSVDTVGWAAVKWDNNFTNSYRYGVQNKYDIQKVGSHAATTPPGTSTIVDTPTTTAPPTAGAGLANALYVGGRVQRGVDWRYGDQDSNGFGTIRELPPKVPEGWVQVEWDNGYINNYRVGADQAYDVMFVPGTYNPSAG